MSKLNFFELNEEKRLCISRELEARTGSVVECTPEYALQKLRQDVAALEEFKRAENLKRGE